MEQEKQNFIQKIMSAGKIKYPAEQMALDRKRDRAQLIDDENYRLMERYKKEIPADIQEKVRGIGLVESRGGDPMYRQGDKHLRNTPTGDNSAYGINQIRPIYLKESMRSAEKHDFRLPKDITPEELQGERRDYIQRMMTAKQIMDKMEKTGLDIEKATHETQNPGERGYMKKVKTKLAQSQ